MIVEALSPVLYKVQGRKNSQVLHHNLIKKCEDREIPFWLRRLRNRLFGQVEVAIGLQDKAPNEHHNEEEAPIIKNHSVYTTRSGRGSRQPSWLRDNFNV